MRLKELERLNNVEEKIGEKLEETRVKIEQRIEDVRTKIEQKIEDLRINEIQKMHIEITKLKMKSGMWGAIAGMLPGAAVLIALAVKGVI